jgi:hypothetical protein
MSSNARVPDFRLRDWAGLVCVLVLAVALTVVAFLTHAGPFILIALLILLIFGLLRHYRERGREIEYREVTEAVRTRLHKGETLLGITVGDRRRLKPLSSVVDFALLMFTQGLAADGSGAVAMDDTFVGLTDRRLIAIDRAKRPVGTGRGWLERLNLRRRDESKGKHTVVFEAASDGLLFSVRLAVFYLARLNIQTADARAFSIGLNCRYWAERAAALGTNLDDHRRDPEIETVP